MDERPRKRSSQTPTLPYLTSKQQTDVHNAVLSTKERELVVAAGKELLGHFSGCSRLPAPCKQCSARWPLLALDTNCLSAYANHGGGQSDGELDTFTAGGGMSPSVGRA